MNVRLAVSESPVAIMPPARPLLLLLFCSLPWRLQLLWQQAILGQPASLCMAVPHGGVARGNSCLESLSAPSPGTLGIASFLTRSSQIISPGQTWPVPLTLGHWGNSSVDQGSEARGPVPKGPLSPHLQAPPTGACAPGAGQGRGWASGRPCPPEAAHTNALQKGLYGLELAARCAKGAWAHPPLLSQKGYIIAKGIPP